LKIEHVLKPHKIDRIGQCKHNDVIATSESDSVHTAQATEPGEKLFK